jgi:predicted SprT family Zn-dependent metalloprotease
MSEASLGWLTRQAYSLVQKYWNLDDIPNLVIDSDREKDWSNTLATYWADTRTIEFKSKINAKMSLRRIKKILLYELCRWRLHVTNKPYRDNDESFIRELIKVGAKSMHNSNLKAKIVFIQARKRKEVKIFELVGNLNDEVIVSRLSHTRKNEMDFKCDLAQVLIKMHNALWENESIYPADVASMMKDLFSYKLEPVSTYAINLSKERSPGEVGDRDDVVRILNKLGISKHEIETKLDEEEE